MIFLFSFSFVFAQGGIVTCSENCQWQDLVNTMTNLVKTIVVISFWLTFLFFTIGAFLIMFGGPRPDLVKRGKDIIWISLWAYILILSSGIIFDAILEFFNPRFGTLYKFIFPKIVLSANGLEPGVYYNPLKQALMSSLRCGGNAQPLFGSQSIGRLFGCIFEVISLLTRVALVLFVLAIIISALYIITTPLFGLKNIERAYKILIWSTVGFIVILLAEVIRAQIERIIR